MISSSVLAAITPEELTRAASVFGSLKQLRLRLSPEETESKLDQEFENHVASVLGRLDGRLPEVQDHPEMKQLEITMARHGLYDAAFQQAVLLGSAISPALGDALKDLRFIHSGFMNDMQGVVATVSDQLEGTTDALTKTRMELDAVETECKNLMEAADFLDKEADVHEQEILDLRSKLRSANQHLEKYSVGAKGSDALSPFVASQRTTGQVFDTKVHQTGLQFGSLSPSRSGMGGQSASVKSDLSASQRSSKPSISVNAASNAEVWLTNFRTELQRAMDKPEDSRMLSFNETYDLIQKFYASKAALNAKCSRPQVRTAAGSVPAVFETMEQHVYRMYEKKYGLRTLALEHCSMFVAALEMYSKSDDSSVHSSPEYSTVDILIFYKIFKNELGENFHEIHLQLGKSIRDLVQLHIMNRYPNKSAEGVQELLDKKMQGVINSEEWTDIVSYLYNGNDARNLQLHLKRAAKEEFDAATNAAASGSPQTAGSPHLLKINSRILSAADREKEAKRLGYVRGGNPGEKTATSKMAYSTPDKGKCFKLSMATFLHTVFSFQLQSHEMYLSKFVRIFHKHDDNGDGVVTADEFRRCFVDTRTQQDANPEALEALYAEVMSRVDPNQTGAVTFTNASEALGKITTNV